MERTRAEIDKQIRELAEAIVAGEIRPLEGSEQMWDLSIEAPWHEHALDTFVYVAAEWREPRVTSEMLEQWSEAVVQAAAKFLTTHGEQQIR